MGLNHISGITSRNVAADTVTQGTICVLNSEGKLAAAGAEATGQLFVTMVDPLERGMLVSAAVAGVFGGSVSVRAAAGTYTAGQLIYCGANGVASLTTTNRKLGTIAESVTLSEAGMVSVFPQFAV